MNKKNILITGVAQGLGRFLADCFAESNYNVIGLDIKKKDELDNNLLEKLVCYYYFDLSNVEGIDLLIKEIIKIHKRVDILINNAGIKSFMYFERYKLKTIKNIIYVNYFAPIALIKSLLPTMKENNFGRIINISSNASYRGYKKATIYSSTKSALNLFTESLSEEIGAFNITINSICPSTIATHEFVGSLSKKVKNKLIKPESVSNKIIYIINSNINGKVIPVIKYKQKVKYIYYDIVKYFKWLFLA